MNIQQLRQKTSLILDIGSSKTRIGKLIDVFLICLITINVIAVILETDPDFLAEHRASLYWLEVFSVAVFTVEFLLRVWSSVDNEDIKNAGYAHPRLHYLFTPMSIIDFIAIAPFYLAFIFNIDLRFLRVLRLLRIFKLTRYSGAMTTLLKVLRDEISTLSAALFIMIVVMVIAASGIYMVENDDQPTVFGSIPKAMWWAIVTLTTVGYGDVVPLSFAGKIFATCIMIAGVGLVALPTGILASSFSDKVKRNRDKLTRSVRKALEDGVIDENEGKTLKEMSRELGVSEEDLLEIQQSLIEHKISTGNTPRNCPHCGETIR